MRHLIEKDASGIQSSGDPLPGFSGNSEFSIMADGIRAEVENEAALDGDDPGSLAVKAEAAKRIAALRLRLFIEARGLTQHEAAILLGVGREHVNRLVRGNATMGDETYRRLHALETEVTLREWIDSKPEYEIAAFEEAAASIDLNAPDRFTATMYALGSVFGPWAWQTFRDEVGTLTPIPEGEATPEALAAQLRAEAAA